MADAVPLPFASALTACQELFAAAKSIMVEAPTKAFPVVSKPVAAPPLCPIMAMLVVPLVLMMTPEKAIGCDFAAHVETCKAPTAPDA
jgi:hypothetical protein